jgi:hypothetical protein
MFVVRIPYYLEGGGHDDGSCCCPGSEGPAGRFLDTFVDEHRGALETDTVVLEMTPPVRSAPPLPEDVGPEQRLGCRWVPDPRGEHRRICIWVTRGRTQASAPSLDR